MTRKMTCKSLLSTVMASAVALALLAPAPARADNKTAKIIAGTAALLIIGAAVASAIDDDDDVYVTRRGHWRDTPRRAYRHRRHVHNAYCRQQHRHRYGDHERRHRYR